MPEDIDISETQIARAFGRTLWSVKEMDRDEVMASAKRFAEGLPFLVSNVEAFCKSVAEGYALAEAEHQRATLH